METTYFSGHFSYVIFRMTTFLAFYFSATRNLTFETLKIGTNNPEIANLKCENHGFLNNHVCLLTEQAGTQRDMSQLVRLEGKHTLQTANCNADLTHYILQIYYET